MALQNPTFPDADWDDLLDQVEQGNVIPIVGEGAVTFGPGNQRLHPALAVELAELLGVNGARMSHGPETASR